MAQLSVNKGVGKALLIQTNPISKSTSLLVNTLLVFSAFILFIAFNLLTSTKAFANNTTLIVWEDEGKSIGLEQAITDYKEQFNVNVIVQEKTFVQALNHLRLDGPSGKGPDLIAIPADQIGVAAEDQLIVPISMSYSHQMDFLQNAVDAVTYNELIYAIPYSLENMVVFYNKEKLDHPYQYLEEYLDYAENSRRQHKDSLGFVAKFDDLYQVYPIIKAYGGYVFGSTRDGHRVNYASYGLGSDEALQAIEYIQSIYKRGLVPKVIQGNRTHLQELRKLFTEGKAAAMISGTWDMVYLLQQGMNFGVAPLPKLPNGHDMSGFNGIRAYAISKYCNNVKEAVRFAYFLNQPKYARLRYRVTGEIPVAVEAIREESDYHDPYLMVFIEQALRNEAIPNTPLMSYIWRPYAKALRFIFEKEVLVNEDAQSLLENTYPSEAFELHRKARIEY